MLSDHQTNEMAMNEKSVCSFSIFWPFFSRLLLVTASLRLSLLPIDQARFWVKVRHVVNSDSSLRIIKSGTKFPHQLLACDSIVKMQ